MEEEGNMEKKGYLQKIICKEKSPRMKKKDGINL